MTIFGIRCSSSWPPRSYFLPKLNGQLSEDHTVIPNDLWGAVLFPWVVEPELGGAYGSTSCWICVFFFFFLITYTYIYILCIILYILSVLIMVGFIPGGYPWWLSHPQCHETSFSSWTQTWQTSDCMRTVLLAHGITSTSQFQLSL